MNTGYTAFSESNAPRLNLMMPVPFEVPPSGKIISFGTDGSDSASFYL